MGGRGVLGGAEGGPAEPGRRRRLHAQEGGDPRRLADGQWHDQRGQCVRPDPYRRGPVRPGTDIIAGLAHHRPLRWATWPSSQPCLSMVTLAYVHATEIDPPSTSATLAGLSGSALDLSYH